MNENEMSPEGRIPRREFLRRSGLGFGSLALAYLLEKDGLNQLAADETSADPLGAKPPHVSGKAKSVIWLFLEGGPSHIDLFDPKPELERLSGKPMPESFGRPITAMGTANNTIMPSQRIFKRHGQSGIWVSDWYPEIAKHVDDLCVLRSCWADGLNHVGSVCQMNTGSVLAGRPSMGAWATYGLGASNDSLPTYVVLTDEGEVNGAAKNWSSGFLPAVYQGVKFRRDGTPIFYLDPPKGIGDERQRRKIDLLKKLNLYYGRDKQEDTELAARINSYELAYRMQSAAPEVVDIAKESPVTKALYGLDDSVTEKFGRNCLLARRMVERGVRFVQCYSGSGSRWDSHSNIEKNHAKMCRSSDQPIAGLLTDLKARGLLDSTLVIWGGEFGRTPFNEKGDGRDHNPWGFTIWMAGGGIKPGAVVGATDEIGLKAIEDRSHVHDIHATIFHAMGLDHERLTFLRNGLHERPTMNEGAVIHKMFA